MNGGMPALPKLSFGVVDVRDVADLHLRAMTDPRAKGERFLAVSGDFMSMREIALTLKARLGAAARRVPTRELPDWLLRLAALAVPSVRQIVRELGKARNATGDKSRRLLGWAPRSREDALVATAESLIRTRALEALRGLSAGTPDWHASCSAGRVVARPACGKIGDRIAARRMREGSGDDEFGYDFGENHFGAAVSSRRSPRNSARKGLNDESLLAPRPTCRLRRHRLADAASAGRTVPGAGRRPDDRGHRSRSGVCARGDRLPVRGMRSLPRRVPVPSLPPSAAVVKRRAPRAARASGNWAGPPPSAPSDRASHPVFFVAVRCASSTDGSARSSALGASWATAPRSSTSA